MQSTSLYIVDEMVVDECRIWRMSASTNDRLTTQEWAPGLANKR